MQYMFNRTMDFNQPLSGWNVSAVQQMESIFYRARSFHQSLVEWKLPSLTPLFTFHGKTCNP
jgi:hypothetical protein